MDYTMNSWQKSKNVNVFWLLHHNLKVVVMLDGWGPWRMRVFGQHSWVDMQAASGAPWIGTMDDPAGFLADRGWQPTLTPVGAPEANYGRWSLPVIPATMPGMPHLWFVVGQKA